MLAGALVALVIAAGCSGSDSSSPPKHRDGHQHRDEHRHPDHHDPADARPP